MIELVGNCHISLVEHPSASSVKRRSILPGQFVDGVWLPTDLSAESTEIQSYAAKVWTAEGVAQFKADNAPAIRRPLPLSRPAFLFMMNKIGITEATVEGIVAQMPSGTAAQADAKALALIVFRNQQTFQRDNALLASLSAAAGLTSKQVDTAWRTAEQLVW